LNPHSWKLSKDLEWRNMWTHMTWVWTHMAKLFFINSFKLKSSFHTHIPLTNSYNKDNEWWVAHFWIQYWHININTMLHSLSLSPFLQSFFICLCCNPLMCGVVHWSFFFSLANPHFLCFVGKKFHKS
jgi:hypothetical protein